jgi:hypothetical protein
MGLGGHTTTALRESQTDVGGQSSSRHVQSKPQTILSTDASSYGLGAVLTGHGKATAGGLHFQVHDSQGKKICPDKKGSLSLHLVCRVTLPRWTPVSHTDGPQATRPIVQHQQLPVMARRF